MANIAEKIKDVGGWLSSIEANLLYNLAKKNPYDGVIVEIGSWKGKSTICLGIGSMENNRNKIIAIDPHTSHCEKLKTYLYENEVSTFSEFQKNIKQAKIDHLIEPIVDFSFNAVHQVNKSIDLIFIDGSHKYEDVLKDLQMFFPKVREGGVIAFHDTNDGGPNKVVLEHLFSSNNFKNVKFADSITYGTKVTQNTSIERIQNAYWKFMFNNFNAFRKKQLPGFVKSIGKRFYHLIRK